MPRFKCTSCGAGFYSAAHLTQLTDKSCSHCGALLVLRDKRSAAEVLADRAGHLIARREVARAQARIDSERLADDGGLAPQPSVAAWL